MACRSILKMWIFLILCSSYGLVGTETPVLTAPQAISKPIQKAFTVQIPMRDGIELPTDIYFPENMNDKLPCILIRSPAGKETYKDAYTPLVESGYVLAIQDTRSYVDPEGKTFPMLSDGWGDLQDGYDTIQWLSKSSFTNGKVGTMGFSAMGIAQNLLAPSAPPALKAQYIGFAASSVYHHAMFMGGRPYKEQVEGWLGSHMKKPEAFLDFIRDQVAYNDFWNNVNANKMAARVQVPALYYGGWYDTFSQGTIDAFQSRQKFGGQGAKGRQKLVMGPWTHYWPFSMKLGDYEIPNQAKKPPVDISAKRWFDFYLKGIENGVLELAPVTYYVMGPFDGTPSSGNVWRTANKWPVHYNPTRFYLGEKGSLHEESPMRKELELSFKYDPANPVPSLGGSNLYIESGPKDQRPIEGRNDVVVFTSQPLTEDLEVTGRIAAKIFFKSDCKETDLSVRLCDVYPDGKSILITDGISSISQPELNGETVIPYTPGEIREVAVDLWSTSIVFAKGHRIRVAVTSSNFPRFEKSLNIAKDEEYLGGAKIAHNAVHLGGRYKSHIVLPVTRRAGEPIPTAAEASRAK